MSDNQLDEFFKNRLSGHLSQVPDNMWQRIITKKENDRKAILFWKTKAVKIISLIVLVGMIAVLSIDLYFVPNKKLKGRAELGKNTSSVQHEAQNIDSNTLKRGRDSLKQFYPTLSVTEFDDARSKTKSAPSHTDRKFRKIEGLPAKTDKRSKLEKGNSFQARRTNVKEDQDDADYISVGSLRNWKYDGLCNRIVLADKIQTLSILPDSVKINPGRADNSADLKPHKDHGAPSAKFAELYFSPELLYNNNSPSSYNTVFRSELSYTIGIRAGFTFARHFTLKSGLEYSQMGQTSKVDSGIGGSHFHYHNIDLPLLFGYQRKGKDFNVAIEGGFLYNIYSWYSAIPSNSNVMNYYKSHAGFSAYLGLTYERIMNGNISIFAEPYFKYRLTNMANESRMFDQKINTLGLNMGVRHYF